MSWLHTHWMPLTALMTTVAVLSYFWVRALARQQFREEEQEEEMARLMVLYSGTYDYRADKFNDS